MERHVRWPRVQAKANIALPPKRSAVRGRRSSLRAAQLCTVRGGRHSEAFPEPGRQVGFLGNPAEVGDPCHRQVGFGQQAAGALYGAFHQPLLRRLPGPASKVRTESGTVDIAVLRKGGHRWDWAVVPCHVFECGINDGIIRTYICDRRLPFHNSHGREANRIRSSTREGAARLGAEAMQIPVFGL